MTQRDSISLGRLAGTEIGEYVLDQHLGSGSNGHVYRARLRALRSEDIFWAIKLSPPEKPLDLVKLLTVMRLQNVANVVHLQRVGTVDLAYDGSQRPFTYAVWDYVKPGRSLRKYIDSGRTIPVSFLFGVLTTILRVLDASCARGIDVHGRLHLGNILVGESAGAPLDQAFRPIDPIYISDFGYAIASPTRTEGDDFEALGLVVNQLIERVDWPSTNSADRQLLFAVRTLLHKALKETTPSERSAPGTLLRALLSFESSTLRTTEMRLRRSTGPNDSADTANTGISVGQFQVSEMLGDDWDLWRKLFVPAVPARSRILEKDITSVITGPRGCGKTMLFRRLSERLIVQCGPIDDRSSSTDFVAFYINANDFADAFPRFSARPSPEEAERLTAFAHICILSDVLAVEAVLCRRTVRSPSQSLVDLLERWFGVIDPDIPIITGESRLERYRSRLEDLKRRFLTRAQVADFPGYAEFTHHGWLQTFVPDLRRACPWVAMSIVFFFVDDYTTPRVSMPMQRVLNRVFFQRSHDFVFKLATEAATTFVPEDSSGKTLQDGDDYRLVDMGEESLFMSDMERQLFLNEVFQRRLALDSRVGSDYNTLPSLLGKQGLKKTAFARLLREAEPASDSSAEKGAGLLRGAVRRKAVYAGHDVFSSLWSGDTRLMIQLMQDLVDDSSSSASKRVTSQILPELQDRAFRNRGGQWLDTQARNQPSDARRLGNLITKHRNAHPAYALVGGSFGAHLKAIAEAFSRAARAELLGPVYVMEENGKRREVPKMAFRLEVTDDFRLDGLAAAVYRDLIRYGIFMRDNRGKSVRGAMVPRLYLRRLLLPYCLLPLSKRDSVSMSCDWFVRLLLQPDDFGKAWSKHRKASQPDEQRALFEEKVRDSQTNNEYDDLIDEDRKDG